MKEVIQKCKTNWRVGIPSFLAMRFLGDGCLLPKILPLNAFVSPKRHPGPSSTTLRQPLSRNARDDRTLPIAEP